MIDDLTRAQHYQALARKMRETANLEFEPKWRDQLMDLAVHYEKLAEKMLAKQVS